MCPELQDEIVTYYSIANRCTACVIGCVVVANSQQLVSSTAANLVPTLCFPALLLLALHMLDMPNKLILVSHGICVQLLSLIS